MSITNLKTKISTLLEIQLEKIQSGDVSWTVSNQHDEHVIETALSNLDGFEALAAKWEGDGMAIYNVAPMAWAFELADVFGA